MNDREQFYNEFYAALENAMEPMGGHLNEIELYKDNSGMQGIRLTFDDILSTPSVFPELYFDDWKRGESVEMLVSGIKTEIQEKLDGIFGFDFQIKNQNELKKNVYAAIVNYDNNKERLKDIPHEKLFDLALYAKYDFGDRYEVGINNRIMADMRMTKEELLRLAKENTLEGRELLSVEDLALEFIYEQGIDEGDIQELREWLPGPAYVFDSRQGYKIDGAVAISSPSILKQIHNQLGDDFYILPCCTDQLLYLPKSKCSTEMEGLEQFVKDFKENEIPIQEQLSDKIYEFDGSTLKIAGSDWSLEKDNLANTITHHRSR